MGVMNGRGVYILMGQDGALMSESWSHVWGN